MAFDSLTTRFSTASRRYQTRSDLCEEADAEEGLKAEFLCPFCAEDFDVVGLCCHIDEEHPVESKNGVCPVCAKKVGADIVGHITTQHENLFKIQRKRRLRKGVTVFSMLRRELREGSLRSLHGGSSGSLSSTNAEPDPLLSSFIFSPPALNEPQSVRPPSVDASPLTGSSKEGFLERKVQQSPSSHKGLEEKIRKCEFLQGLLLSTFLDDKL